MLGGGDPELVVEAVVPDLGHVVPVVDDAVLDGVGELEHSLLGLRLLAHVGLFVVHAHHDVVVLGGADDRGEGRPGGVVSGQTGLAHS